MAKAKGKKNKNKDFQKVKLKVGKKLPRGLNETVATFKTRGINIKEQLKSQTTASEQTTTKRKLNITEVLSQTSHYSATTRHEALTGLRDLVRRDRKLLHSHLALIIEKVAVLTVDKDGVVRTAVCKVFKTMFPLVSANQIAPFFGVISAHLCCAMTHIHDDIQMDSLDVMDLCVAHYPRLVTHQSAQILPNFLHQISTHTASSSGGSKQRRLLVNPQSKLSSQKGRLKVLQRLHNFYAAIVSSSSNTDRAVSTRPDDTTKTCVWKEGSPLRVEIRPSHHISYWVEDLTFKFGTRTSVNQESANNTELVSFSAQLVPLLLECWAEAAPAHMDNNLSGNALSGEAISTLWHVLGISQLLLQLTQPHAGAQTNPLKEQFQEDFVTHFMPNFPYAMHDTAKRVTGSMTSSAKRSKKNKNGAADVSILSLNLKLCQVMGYFMEASNSDVSQSKSASKWQTRITSFLRDLPPSDLDREQVISVVHIIRKLLENRLSKDAEEWVRKKAYTLYKARLGTHASELPVFVHFFAQLAFAPSSPSARSPVTLLWVSSLPKVFSAVLKHSSFNEYIKDGLVTQLLHLMAQAGARKHDKFLRNLDELLFNSLLKEPENTSLHKLTVKEQLSVIQLLHWLPNLDKPRLSSLARLCRCQRLDLRVVRVIFEMVQWKIQEKLSEIANRTDLSGVNEDVGEESARNQILADFLSFICSVGLGIVPKYGKHETSRIKCGLSSRPLLLDNTEQSAANNHLLKLSQECAAMVTGCATGVPIGRILTQYILKSWKTSDCMPVVNAVCSLSLLIAALKTTATDSDCASNQHQTPNLSAFEEFPDLEPLLAETLISVSSVLMLTSSGRLTVTAQNTTAITSPKSVTQQSGHSSGQGSNAEMLDLSQGEEVDTGMECEAAVQGLDQASVETGIRVCQQCMNALPQAKLHFVQRLCSTVKECSDRENLETAVSMLTELVLPSVRPRSAEVHVLRDLCSWVPHTLAPNTQWWSDFMYKVSLFK